MPTRKNFLRTSGLSILPAFIPFSESLASAKEINDTPPDQKFIKFYGDGIVHEPGDYLEILKQAHAEEPIQRDRYGSGGIVEKLEKKFCEITGKEKAILMPTGTMANQFAMNILSRENTKVIVHDQSHSYRDEADAAQSVFTKRLVPLGAGKPYFSFDELRSAIEGLPNEEVFRSPVGAVAIENPVRRADGRIVPIEEIKLISDYCRKNNIGLHLDGARIYMASAWSGVSIKEYASYFDTVYISLYKYLGASAGAVLCGDAATISKMPHQMKVHGGVMAGNFTNAAMAHHTLKTFDEKLKLCVKAWNELYPKLNRLTGIKISALNNGSNVYRMEVSREVNSKSMLDKLREFNIRMYPPDQNNVFMISINETILNQPAEDVVKAFTRSIA